MAEFLTMQEAEDKFGKKGILGGLFGGNCIAMQTAMAQGQMSQNLAWNNSLCKMILTYTLTSMVGI